MSRLVVIAGVATKSSTQAMEAGLRVVLRLLKTDCHVVYRLPSRSEMLEFEKEPELVYLHLWADAHAPSFQLTKSISGQVMFFEKSLARDVEVSERLLLGIGETAPETVVNVLFELDSASALQLIHAKEVSSHGD